MSAGLDGGAAEPSREAILEYFSISEAEIVFNQVPIGDTGEQLLSLRNESDYEVRLPRVAIEGAGFALEAETPENSGPGQSLLPGATRAWRIHFSPSETIRYDGQVYFVQDEPSRIHQVPVQGYGSDVRCDC